MHKNTIDLSGKRFFKLLVRKASQERRERHVLWECRCDCGKVILRAGKDLKKSERSSCGCFMKDPTCTGMYKHGKTKTSIYKTWSKIKDRCFNEKCKAYKHYGGRGIGVSIQWMKFENFYRDMGDKPSPKHEIDRIDNNGHYTKDNCRWATPRQQSRNKRNNKWITYKGKTMCLVDWAKELEITPATLLARLTKMSVEKAITAKHRYWRHIERLK